MSTACSRGRRKRRQFLVEQMEEFFFGTGSALPSEFVPPTH
jgi:Fe-S cluster biosynthesis and repair protein YggX